MADVFVSYAHGPGPDPEGRYLLRDWTNKLTDRLQGDLRTIGPKFENVRVWDDREVDPLEGLSEQLKGIVEQSTFLIVVMTPFYVESEWCEDERDWFAAQVRRRDPASDRDRRIFVIRARPTARESWPDFLKDGRGSPLTGFQFHPPGRDELEFPYGWPLPGLDDRDFNRALAPLRTALARRLTEIWAVAKQKALVLEHGAELGATAARPRLYLHAPAEAEAQRTDVKKTLDQQNCIVVTAPSIPGPGIAAGLAESQGISLLARSCDALTVLRVPEQRSFEADVIDVIFGDRERLSSGRARPLPCAVIDRVGGEKGIFVDLERLGVRRFDATRDPAWPQAVAAWARHQQADGP